MRARDLQSADDVAILGTELLGVDPARAAGVVHALASWVDAGGNRFALRIHAATPHSDTDSFLLNLARARAEAIVTTGAILREEPGVTHALQGPGHGPEALAAWRRDVVGLHEPPILLVLSSGRRIDPEHPAFRAPVRPVLFVPEAAAPALEAAFRPSARVAASAQTSARSAVDWLWREGIARITVEAGPGAAAALYRRPCEIDELWRSTYLEHELLREVIGPAVARDVELARDFSTVTGGSVVQEASGAWKFERWARPSAPSIA